MIVMYRPTILIQKKTCRTICKILQPMYWTEQCLLALRTPHVGDWLLALPVIALGIRLFDEVLRVAVGVRLATTLCETHFCVTVERECVCVRLRVRVCVCEREREIER